MTVSFPSSPGMGGQWSVSRRPLFYNIGNFVPYIIKTLREDAHSREKEVCRRRPRSARACARAHAFLYPKGIPEWTKSTGPKGMNYRNNREELENV